MACGDPDTAYVPSLMAAVVLFAFVLSTALALLLARYASNPWIERARAADARRRGDPRPRITPTELRSLVIELLGKLNIEVLEEELRGAERRLVAAERGSKLHASRYVVFVEPSPPGDVVEQPLVVELAESVKVERGATGLLFTPYAIETDGLAGLEVPVELVDGARLRLLVAQYLPERLSALEKYRGFGLVPRISAPVAPRPA